MRRPLSILVTAIFAFAVLATASLAATGPVSAATPGSTTTCSNGVDNPGGKGLICQVTIINTISPSGGSAKVTIRECHGAAGAPTAACKTTVTHLTRLVTNVNQCNGSINGGGGTLRCNVVVTNDFVGLKTGATAVTVNQCVGSGSITTGCDPFPATTTGATITQCNGSAGGGTLVGLRCTASGTKPSSHGVRVNQCNGSGNGGGSLVVCSARIINRTVTTSGSTPSAPNTSTADALATLPSGISPLVLAGLSFLVALSLIAGYRRFDRADDGSVPTGSTPR